MENVQDYFALTLVGGEDFDGPVGGDANLVDEFAIVISLNVLPG